jgi:hypothetical protein
METSKTNAWRESQIDRKMNPKSQENHRQDHDFLQFPLLQISENTMQINGAKGF